MLWHLKAVLVHMVGVKYISSNPVQRLAWLQDSSLYGKCGIILGVNPESCFSNLTSHGTSIKSQPVCSRNTLRT